MILKSRNIKQLKITLKTTRKAYMQKRIKMNKNFVVNLCTLARVSMSQNLKIDKNRKI